MWSKFAGGGDADAAVGGEDGTAADLGVGLEGGAEAVEDGHLKAAEVAAVSEGARPLRLEWVADGADVAGFGDAEERTGDLGEEVRVLVGVEVGDGDAGALELADLGEGFAFDVCGGDFVEEEGFDEVDEFRAEVFAVVAEEGGDGFGRRGGDAVGEGDVAADGERGVGVGDGDGVVEGVAGGHEGGGGEDAGLVELADGAIDAWSEAEVVGVDDEAGGHSLGKNFDVGLARVLGP